MTFPVEKDKLRNRPFQNYNLLTSVKNLEYFEKKMVPYNIKYLEQGKNLNSIGIGFFVFLVKSFQFLNLMK